MISVDVFIPTAGRESLPTVLDQWRSLAVRLKPHLDIRVYGLADGRQALKYAKTCDWFLKCRSKTERPGDLVAKAISMSNADYVLHGFDDDPPSAVDVLIHTAESKSAAWASGQVEEYSSGEKTGVVYQGIPTDGLLHRNSVPLQGCVFRREVFDRVPFICTETLPWAYDWELTLRLHYCHVSHAYVDTPVGVWNINPSGITSSVDTPTHTRLWQDRREDVRKRYRANSRRG